MKSLPVLPPQFIHHDQVLKVEKTLKGNKIRRLDTLANDFTYFQIVNGYYDLPYLELGNEIIPPGNRENSGYCKALLRYNEVVYDNECRKAKYEMDMAEYRAYVEKYRTWLASKNSEQAIDEHY
jgi:hypothetical protein